MKWVQRLKERWGVESNLQFWKIMLVFALTGMSAVQIRKVIFPFIGIDEFTPWYIKIPVWLLVITPFYYVFLTVYAWIFRETKFFGAIMKKSIGRFMRKNKTEVPVEEVTEETK